MLYAPLSALVWLVIVPLVGVAVCLLAGTSRQTWFDPSNAIAIFLLGTVFVLYGLFISGASTFGPVHELYVGADPAFGNNVNLYTNVWETHYEGNQRIDTRLELVGTFPFTESESHLYDSWITYCDDHNKKVFPVRVQVSTWDSRIHWMMFTGVNPAITIGSPAKHRVTPFFELLVGAVLLSGAFLTWKEARHRGIRLRSYDPFALLDNGEV